MEDIKKDILEVYGVTGALKDGPATEGKQTIEILKVSSNSIFSFFVQDIEVAIEDNMKFLSYVVEYQDFKFKDKVKRAEKKLKDDRTQAQKIQREKDIREQNNKLQEDMKARMNRVVKKIGKPDMKRLYKKPLEEKKVEQKVDPETQDQLYYLGLDLKELPE